MSRTPRDLDAERAAIQAATGRLLAGTPLHSASGKLTTTELITECGLRRDVVYEHRALVDDFKAQAKARHSVPEAAQKLADRVTTLQTELKSTKADLVRERETSAYLRRVIAELSIELEQARQASGSRSTVTPLGTRRDPRPASRPH
jgi:septal ring factor EnvC (AmiA/AmiB activator)